MDGAHSITFTTAPNNRAEKPAASIPTTKVPQNLQKGMVDHEAPWRSQDASSHNVVSPAPNGEAKYQVLQRDSECIQLGCEYDMADKIHSTNMQHQRLLRWQKTPFVNLRTVEIPQGDPTEVLSMVEYQASHRDHDDEVKVKN